MTTPSSKSDMLGGPRRKYVVGITGASGALYAKRVIAEILRAGHECHLCVSPYGQRLLFDELGIERLDGESLAAFAGIAHADDERSESSRSARTKSEITISDLRASGLHYYPSRDVGAAIGSGSFRHDGMVIVPCSSNTMNQIACGTGDTLVTRAAAVAMKERMKLIVAHREAPLTLIDIRAMETLTLSGAIVCPCNPGFYLLPTKVEQVIDFVAGRLLDLLGVEHGLKVRWAEHLASTNGEPRDEEHAA
jgi:4-hydroxy-3-polyprenylbenzoate decarboxylase